jgi:phospholipase/carboxylesterase
MPAVPLPFRLHLPSAWRAGNPVVVLLHGRGSSEDDLQGLAPFLPEGWALVTPRAPYPGAPWGYGPGWAWYRYVEDDRVESETLESSLRKLDGFMDALPALLGGEPGTRILGGFSQGGTMSVAWGLTRPGQVHGVINLSGFLARIPSVDAVLEHAIREQAALEIPVFWGHGHLDPAIPFSLGQRGRTRLRAGGAQVTESDHPGGHTITPQEAHQLADWLRARSDAPRTP